MTQEGEKTVAELMTSEVISVSPEQPLRDAINLLRMHRIRHLPIVNDSVLVGILTDRDIKRATPSLLSGVGQSEYDRVFDGTQVGQVMTRDPLTVTPRTTLVSALETLVHRKIGALPVVEEERLVGIVTEHDFLREFLARLKA
jgi:CBS domain-containing protein